MARCFLIILLASILSLFTETYAQVTSLSPQTIDSSFQFASTNTPTIRDLLVLPDGKIAFAGTGSIPWGILNRDGSSNLTAYPSDSANAVNSLALNEEHILIKGGHGSSVFGLSGPVSLANGPYDESSFLLAAPSIGEAEKVVIQNDEGDILSAGNFPLSAQSNVVGLVRLKRTGRVDPVFDTQSSQGMFVHSAAVNAAGQIFASYTCTNDAGGFAWNFGRWFENGVRDTNFASDWLVSLAADAHISVLVRTPGLDSFFAAVQFTREKEVHTQIKWLNASGEPIEWANLPDIVGSVNAIGFCPAVSFSNDGSFDQVLVAGDFSRIGQASCNDLISLSKSGAVLWSFAPNEGPNKPIKAVAGQTDGRVLIGGTFDQVSGVPEKAIARLEGLGASSKTYVYWDNAQYQGFEKDGFVELALNRRGNTETNLDLAIHADLPGETRLARTNFAIHFAPGETHQIIFVPILQNERRDGRVAVKFVLSSFESENESVLSYSPTTLRILDDETAGTLDPFFKSPTLEFASAMALQPDGKMLVGYTYNGPHILRVNTDGSVDSTFFTNGVPNANKTATVSQIEVAPDAKIYIGGNFTSGTRYGTNFIARLNSDGTLDTSFNPSLAGGNDFEPGNFALQPDGKILVAQASESASYLQHAQGMNIRPPFRLNHDGSFDFSFGIAMGRSAYSMRLQADGRLLVASGAGGFQKTEVSRFRSNGALDTNFMVRPTGSIIQLLITGDSLLLGGTFTAVNGQAATNMARVSLADGSLDSSFACQTDGSIYRVIAGKEGKIYITGTFTKVNGADRYRLARLNSNGSLDLDYDPGMGFSQPPRIGFQGDGKLLATTGTSSTFPLDIDLVPSIGLVRLEDAVGSGQIRLVSNRIVAKTTDAYVTVEVERIDGSDGALSATFQTSDGSALNGLNYVRTNGIVTFADGEFGRRSIVIPILTNSVLSGNKTLSLSINTGMESLSATVLIQNDRINSLAPQFTIRLDSADSVIRDFITTTNGTILVGGVFNSIQGVPMTNLARLNPDFTVDTNFIPQGPAVPPLSRLAARPDGRILAGGQFTKVGNSNWGPVIQLNSDLSYDTVFNSSIPKTWGLFPKEPLQLSLLPNGFLMEADANAFRRVDTNGFYDSSFMPSSSRVNIFLPLADGRLLVGTSDTIQTLRRLNANGSTDPNFIVKADFKPFGTGAVREIVPDGHDGFYIGGDFNEVNTFPGARLAHIYSDGQVDTNFLAEVGTNSNNSLNINSVRTIALLDNGDLLAGGNFLQAGGHDQRLIAMLGANGQLREGFSPKLEGANVQKISILPNGNALVLGSITNVNGVDTDGLFELRFAQELPPVVQFLSPIDGTNFNVGDAIAPIEIKVHAFDPDNFLKEVRVDLDGVPIGTNQIGDFSLSIYPPGAGPHQLKATAIDEAGLTSSASANFTGTLIPFPPSLTISQNGEGIIINYSGYQLQESEDLQVWTDVQQSGPNQYRVIPGAAHRFYRVLK
jgi:uncharacterized delta-60 repeat protein